jgi:hypothetical protein
VLYHYKAHHRAAALDIVKKLSRQVFDGEDQGINDMIITRAEEKILPLDDPNNPTE